MPYSAQYARSGSPGGQDRPGTPSSWPPPPVPHSAPAMPCRRSRRPTARPPPAPFPQVRSLTPRRAEEGSAARPRRAPGGRGEAAEEVRIPPTTRAEIIGPGQDLDRGRGAVQHARVLVRRLSAGLLGLRLDGVEPPRKRMDGQPRQVRQRISKDRLEPGDMLLFHNPTDPRKGSHVVIFGGWTDYTQTHYIAYESARPYARRQATPYAYWDNATRYVPYRYKGLTGRGRGMAGRGDGRLRRLPRTRCPAGQAGEGPGAKGAAGPPGGDRFPGPEAFGPGAHNTYVTRLGQHAGAARRGPLLHRPAGTASGRTPTAGPPRRSSGPRAGRAASRTASRAR